MRLEKDYFLEDYLDIHMVHVYEMIVTYDTLFHQSLEEYLTTDTNILIKGDALNISGYEKNRWYLLRGCYIEKYIIYGNFIMYTIKIGKIENDSYLHVQRKLKIKKLMGIQHLIAENI